MASASTGQEVTAFVGYVPVINDGYERLFSSMPDPRSCYILGSDIIWTFDHLRKDIRALRPERAARYLEMSGYFGKVVVLHAGEYESIGEQEIWVPDDELAEATEQQLPGKDITRYPVFLRWDRNTSKTSVEVVPHRTIDAAHLEDWVVPTLTNERLHASNWWRWVSAAVKTSKGQILAAHNHHLPTDYSIAIDGDIRMNFGRGADLGMTTDIHAEAGLISQAARDGISLDGAEVFVSTFTCPPCAKLVAVAGIRRCFYVEGYAMGDAKLVLEDVGIEIVKVLGVEFNDDPTRLRPYKEKSS